MKPRSNSNSWLKSNSDFSNEFIILGGRDYVNVCRVVFHFFLKTSRDLDLFADPRIVGVRMCR